MAQKSVEISHTIKILRIGKIDTFLDNFMAKKVKNITQCMKNMVIIRKIIAENMQNNSMWKWKEI